MARSTVSTVDNRVNALFREALALQRGGKLAEAEQCCSTILGIEENNSRALTLLGIVYAQQGDYPQAIKVLGLSLKIDDTQPTALNILGNALREAKRHDDALACYNRAISLRADFPAAHFNKGLTLELVGRLTDALSNYDKAISLKPDYPEAHNNRGNVLVKLRRYGDALESFERAIRLKPNSAQIHNNCGTALRTLRRFAEALESYDKALALDSNYVEAHINRGLALEALKRTVEALASYDKAIAIRPDDADAHYNRGNALLALKHFDAALKSYDKAIALRPYDPKAHYSRGLVMLEFKRFDAALLSIDRAIELDPELPYGLGTRLETQMRMCAWAGLRETRTAILAGIERGLRAANPFSLLALECLPVTARRCAEIYVQDKHPPQPVPSLPRHEQSCDRIRIAYLSADFRAHATAILATGLFEHHDKQRFETYAISFGPNDGSQMRARLTKAFEHFLDVRDMDDRAVAELMRLFKIDIAVDLMGFTKDSRTGIFALRPAPIQVNYLGFPGTMGADYIDYLIADRTVIPEEDRGWYAEQIVYLPDTYQCTDSRRPAVQHAPSRVEVGLPTEGFVFCSFNGSFKITPEIFDIWMRLLAQTERSVLWLLESNAMVPLNLRREAEARGIAPDRLVFGRVTPHADHLARLHLADLFLDTLPCGAHTTASDALWAGLPILTCVGNTFEGRVAASLLNAIGLKEMVTRSLAEYESRALALACDSSALAEVRAKLARNRPTYPLFDTARFTRHLEAAYERMMEIRYTGKPPTTFTVEPAGARAMSKIS